MFIASNKKYLNERNFVLAQGYKLNCIVKIHVCLKNHDFDPGDGIVGVPYMRTLSNLYNITLVKFV